MNFFFSCNNLNEIILTEEIFSYNIFIIFSTTFFLITTASTIIDNQGSMMSDLK